MIGLKLGRLATHRATQACTAQPPSLEALLTTRGFVNESCLGLAKLAQNLVKARAARARNLKAAKKSTLKRPTKKTSDRPRGIDRSDVQCRCGLAATRSERGAPLV